MSVRHGTVSGQHGGRSNGLGTVRRLVGVERHRGS